MQSAKQTSDFKKKDNKNEMFFVLHCVVLRMDTMDGYNHQQSEVEIKKTQWFLTFI